MSNSIHFYRILTPDFHSQLILPLGLSRALPSENSEVTLTNSTTKKSWKIDVISVGGRHYFGGERWHEFTVSNGLDYGFILIFCFDGGVCFSFHAYNLRGLEINVASSENVNANANKEDEVLDSPKKMDAGTSGVAKDDDLDFLNKIHLNTSEEDNDKKDDHLDTASWDWDDDEDDENADYEENKEEEPKSSNLREEVTETTRRRHGKQKHTLFYTKMTAKHLDGGPTSYEFYVPKRFSNAVDISDDKKEVRIVDPHGQSRIIGCRHRIHISRGNRSRETLLTKGWRKLVLENGLKVGETYKFELVTKVDEDGLITVRMTLMN